MSNSAHNVPLTGLNGSNPLHFLAALGVFAECSGSDQQLTLKWQRAAGAWRPVLMFSEPQKESDQAESTDRESSIAKQSAIAEQLVRALRIDRAKELARDKAVAESVDEADKAWMQARRAVRDAENSVKKRKLRGAERDAAIRTEVDPLREEVARTRNEWLARLEKSRPLPELKLGKAPAAQRDHFRNTAESIATHAETRCDRRSADLMAAFGCDAVFDEKTERVRTTLFCFVTGSGHQYFLETASDLLTVVDAERIRAAIFEQQPHNDEKLSLRWDPIEDRRYAMMWSDPTSSGNKATTNWALNLLAYRGLQFFPTAPIGQRLATTGFTIRNRQPEFTWPIWSVPVTRDTVRSVLAMRELQQAETDRQQLAGRGFEEVFRSTRLQVGNPPLHKLNFSPARSV